MVGDLTQILCALNATDGFSNMTERWPVAFSFWAKPAELLKQTPNSNSRKLAPARSKNCRLEMLFAAAHQSVSVKVFGRRPHDDGAARTGAGVRKPPMEMLWGGGEDIASIVADVNRWSAPCRS